MSRTKASFSKLEQLELERYLARKRHFQSLNPDPANLANLVVAKFTEILPFSLSNLLVKISYKVNLLSK